MSSEKKYDIIEEMKRLRTQLKEQQHLYMSGSEDFEAYADAIRSLKVAIFDLRVLSELVGDDVDYSLEIPYTGKPPIQIPDHLLAKTKKVYGKSVPARTMGKKLEHKKEGKKNG